MTPRRLYKYASLSKHTIQTLALQTIYFSDPIIEFNDPYDCNLQPTIRTRDEFLDSLRSYARALGKPIDEPTLNKIVEMAPYENGTYVIDTRDYYGTIPPEAGERAGVFCLSEKGDDILMYTHYADNHKGVCIEFDSEKLVEAVRQYIYPVQYSESYPEFNVFSLDSQAVANALYLMKSIGWAYEKEWRMINYKGSGLFRLPDGVISGVTLGCEATQQDQDLVKTLVRAKGIRLFQATRATRQFALSIELIDGARSA